MCFLNFGDELLFFWFPTHRQTFTSHNTPLDAVIKSCSCLLTVLITRPPTYFKALSIQAILCDQGEVPTPTSRPSYCPSSWGARLYLPVSPLHFLLDPSKVHSLSSFTYSRANGPVPVYTMAPLSPTTTSINKSNRGQRSSLWEPFTVYFIRFQLFSCITSMCNYCCVYYWNTRSLYNVV